MFLEADVLNSVSNDASHSWESTSHSTDAADARRQDHSSDSATLGTPSPDSRLATADPKATRQRFLRDVAQRLRVQAAATPVATSSPLVPMRANWSSLNDQMQANGLSPLPIAAQSSQLLVPARSRHQRSASSTSFSEPSSPKAPSSHAAVYRQRAMAPESGEDTESLVLARRKHRRQRSRRGKVHRRQNSRSQPSSPERRAMREFAASVAAAQIQQQLQEQRQPTRPGQQLPQQQQLQTPRALRPSLRQRSRRHSRQASGLLPTPSELAELQQLHGQNAGWARSPGTLALPLQSRAGPRILVSTAEASPSASRSTRDVSPSSTPSTSLNHGLEVPATAQAPRSGEKQQQQQRLRLTPAMASTLRRLTKAVRTNSAEQVETVLNSVSADEANAILNASDRNGRSVLFDASLYANMPVCKLLIDRGARCNKDNFGATAIDVAVEAKKFDVVRMMFTHESHMFDVTRHEDLEHPSARHIQVLDAADHRSDGNSMLHVEVMGGSESESDLHHSVGSRRNSMGTSRSISQRRLLLHRASSSLSGGASSGISEAPSCGGSGRRSKGENSSELDGAELWLRELFDHITNDPNPVLRWRDVIDENPLLHVLCLEEADFDPKGMRPSKRVTCDHWLRAWREYTAIKGKETVEKLCALYFIKLQVRKHGDEVVHELLEVPGGATAGVDDDHDDDNNDEDRGCKANDRDSVQEDDARVSVDAPVAGGDKQAIGRSNEGSVEEEDVSLVDLRPPPLDTNNVSGGQTEANSVVVTKDNITGLHPVDEHIAHAYARAQHSLPQQQPQQRQQNQQGPYTPVSMRPVAHQAMHSRPGHRPTASLPQLHLPPLHDPHAHQQHVEHPRQQQQPQPAQRHRRRQRASTDPPPPRPHLMYPTSRWLPSGAAPMIESPSSRSTHSKHSSRDLTSSRASSTFHTPGLTPRSNLLHADASAALIHTANSQLGDLPTFDRSLGWEQQQHREKLQLHLELHRQLQLAGRQNQQKQPQQKPQLQHPQRHAVSMHHSRAASMTYGHSPRNLYAFASPSLQQHVSNTGHYIQPASHARNSSSISLDGAERWLSDAPGTRGKHFHYQYLQQQQQAEDNYTLSDGGVSTPSVVESPARPPQGKPVPHAEQSWQQSSEAAGSAKANGTSLQLSHWIAANVPRREGSNGSHASIGSMGGARDAHIHERTPSRASIGDVAANRDSRLSSTLKRGQEALRVARESREKWNRAASFTSSASLRS